MYVGVFTYVCMNMWRPEVNLEIRPLACSTSFFEAKPLIEPRSHQFI